SACACVTMQSRKDSATPLRKSRTLSLSPFFPQIQTAEQVVGMLVSQHDRGPQVAHLPVEGACLAAAELTPSSTLTSPLRALATARWGWPSPLKPPTATETGKSPAAKWAGRWKVPSPLPSSTLTVLSF